MTWRSKRTGITPSQRAWRISRATTPLWDWLQTFSAWLSLPGMEVEARVGVTLVLKRIEVTGALTGRTREFETQKEADAFGLVVALLKF